MSQQYSPSVPPQLNDDLLPYLSDEFLRVALAVNNLLSGQWEINRQLPIRLKPGWVGYLAGVPANPSDPSDTGSDPLGTGVEGIYRFGTDGWHYIG